jgi:hypothetical protein
VSAPYYVAVCGGFLVVEYYGSAVAKNGKRERICKSYTIADVRSATTWPTFELADAVAKWAVAHLYPPDLRYFAVLQVASGAAPPEMGQ